MGGLSSKFLEYGIRKKPIIVLGEFIIIIIFF